MHVRISRVTRNGKTYAYAQLVESYRRPDGVPAHRVVANLGQLSPTQIDNLRTALAAGREGEHVAIARAPARAPRRPQVNLQYLDLAVLLELWREWDLHRLLTDLLPRGEADVSPADVVLALVLQRCVAPRSTLFAERWFPRTSLPELLAIVPSSFNNTRLHRALDELDAITPSLMNRLPTLYLEHARRAAFVSLYLDVSDAAFVGHGPALAVRGKTKEGLLLRKIGIVLLCNEHGYPLRWRVVAGNAGDSVVMTDMFRAVADTRWAKDTPIVCDRAMGKTALVRAMAATGLRFLTALTTTEFDTYAPRLPWENFSALRAPSPGDDRARADAITHAREQAKAAGLERLADNLWVCDLGHVEVDASGDADLDPTPTPKATAVAHALDLCRKVEQAVADKRFVSFNAAGRAHGLSKAMTKRLRVLGRLSQDVQEAIFRGEADRCSVEQIVRVARVTDPTQQRARFVDLLADVAACAPRRMAQPAASATHPPQAPLVVRVVAYFNPERFVEQRVNAERHKTAIADFVRTLNERLASPRSRLDRVKILAAVDRRLRRDDLLRAFRVSVLERRNTERVYHRVQLDLVDAEWERRYRCHGFTVLVAHTGLQHSAAELCRLYRAKDKVEKDFQTIKSVTKLRPIRHHTDAKVSAHVTLCMLALLLERRLEDKLNGLCSAPEALEILATCHLNAYRGASADAVPLYALTEADSEQVALLRKLRMQLLVDAGDLAARITPRLHLQPAPKPAKSEG
jgi:hypothetical protein